MVKQHNLIKLFGSLVLFLAVTPEAHAMWPPSTAFEEGSSSILYGFIVIAFVIGIVLGVWVNRSRHEHK